MSAAASIRNDVLRLLRREGRALIIRRNTGGAYDATTGVVPPSTDDTEFGGIGRMGNYADSVVDGKQIQRGDRRVTFIPEEDDYADPTYLPIVGDVVVIDDTTDGGFSVVDFKTRELGGELICYTLQVRNG